LRRRRSPSPLCLTGHPGLAKLVTMALQMLTPPPDLTVSQWADANRRLSFQLDRRAFGAGPAPNRAVGPPRERNTSAASWMPFPTRISKPWW
jgi:hypothetical protein